MFKKGFDLGNVQTIRLAIEIDKLTVLKTYLNQREQIQAKKSKSNYKTVALST